MPISRKKFPPCPIERTLAALSGRWKAMIVWQLFDAPRRYSDLADAIDDITPRALTYALRELEQDGVVGKHEGRWQLTALGAALEAPMRSLYAWGERHALAFPDR
ncbi:MAG: helix-turn-helix domain-containing protein [Acidobacteriota bacterium]